MDRPSDDSGNISINNTPTRSKLDDLSKTSRSFYERAVFKIYLSLMYGSFSVMFLGLCVIKGGQSSSFGSQSKAKDLEDADDDIKKYYNALIGGYGR
jgi:hypothetical protein